MEPLFLTLAEVIDIHNDQIDRYGGEAGARDMGLLESALAVPQAGFGGERLHSSLFEIAAQPMPTISPRTSPSWTATSARRWPRRSSSWNSTIFR